MFTATDFATLLGRMEGETLDFKEAGYNFSDEDSRLKFVKDVVCMANTPRDSSAYIVIGVRHVPGKPCELIGITEHPDDANLQTLFSNRVNPLPSFTYHILRYNNQDFGIIEIFPKRAGPVIPTKNLKALQYPHIYFRRGSKNDVALPDDLARILN